MYLHCWCIVGRFYIYEMSLNVFWNTLFDSISNSWVQHRKRNMKGTLLLFPWTHNVLLFISIQYVATSVTRWPNDMFKFGHLQLCKFAPSIEFSPKSIWISCQILCKCSSYIDNFFKISPKWRNFAKSDHTDGYPPSLHPLQHIALEISVPSLYVSKQGCQCSPFGRAGYNHTNK